MWLLLLVLAAPLPPPKAPKPYDLTPGTYEFKWASYDCILELTSNGRLTYYYPANKVIYVGNWEYDRKTGILKWEEKVIGISSEYLGACFEFKLDEYGNGINKGNGLRIKFRETTPTSVANKP